jgi:hypothetical protein
MLPTLAVLGGEDGPEPVAVAWAVRLAGRADWRAECDADE